MKTIWARIWPEIKPFKFKVLIIFLSGIFVSGTKSIISPLLEELMKAWETRNQERALEIPLMIAGFWIAANVGRYINMFWMKYMADVVTVNLRRKLMNKYLHLNMLYRQNLSRGSGGLISRLINDIQIVNNNLDKLSDLFSQPFMILFSVIVIASIDIELLLITLIVIPIILAILKRFARSLRKYGYKNQESMEDLTNTLKESLDGARIVQSFNLESEMQDRFDQDATRFLKTRRSILSREEASGPISEVILVMALSAILYLFGLKIFSGEIHSSSILKFVAASGFLADSVKKTQYAYVKLQQSAVAITRMEDILQAPEPEQIHSKGVLKFPKNWKTIEYRDVCFSFDNHVILNNLNLKVHRGEMIAIVGSSGGGKSTFVNLLERFYEPDSGQILIDETPIKEIQLKELRKSIALVTQDVFLFSDSIENNIRWGSPTKDKSGVVQAAKAANAHNFISHIKSDYKKQVGEKGDRLSGGEKQRISIARAIYKDAPILILDEATSSLDSENELEVQKGLDQLMRGRTSFVISHRLSTIAQANRIIVIKNGTIFEQGQHEDLMTLRGEYFRFHEIQKI